MPGKAFHHDRLHETRRFWEGTGCFSGLFWDTKNVQLEQLLSPKLDRGHSDAHTQRRNEAELKVQE